MKATPDLIHIGSLKSWMAPECVSINRVPMRATIYPFPSAQTARSVDREKTPWFQLLNGQWQFKAVDRPENVALADVAMDCDRSNWDSVEVPGNWTLQGYGAPQYTTFKCPFPTNRLSFRKITLPVSMRRNFQCRRTGRDAA